jgi:hypothetical protein
MSKIQPRFPAIRVDVTNRNPLVLVAIVREALRLARVEKEEIREFSDEALALDQPKLVHDVCSRWVSVSFN